MTPRERFIYALERKPLTGLVPHFELVFFLTMEVFGKVHPLHRDYKQFYQMSVKERMLHLEDIADIHVMIANKYDHSAIFLQGVPGGVDEYVKVLEIIKEKSDGKYFTMIHGDATFEIPSGDEMEGFSYRLADEPEKVHETARSRVDAALERGEKLLKGGVLDGFALCSDYCYNTNPFLSPAMFGEFITPYLARLIKGYRDMGYYTIKHTDGNIMPVLDQLAETNPHALHSIDPQAGVDIAVIKSLIGKDICLIGNVHCGHMQTGTDQDVIDSAKYALKHGMPGGGYVFSTSNCIYTGMDLKRYELMLDVWRREGVYE